jgi:PAS domain S-box-containing protein
MTTGQSDRFDSPAGDEHAGESGTAHEAVGHRTRFAPPTPTRLFAERHGGADRPAQPGSRSTQVVPALAQQASQPASPNGDAGSIEYPPDLVFIVRADGTVLYVNRPLGKRGEEEVIGSDLYDWIFPEQHLLVREAMGRVFATGRADGLELNGIQQHDADAWYECRIAPNVRDGKVVSATIIARDVSRYKRAERALRAEHEELRQLLEERSADLAQARADLSREVVEVDAARMVVERFRTLLDAAGEAIFVTDSATDTLVDLNETACRWLRHPRAELLGKNVRTLGLEFPVMPPLAFDVQFTETRDSRRPLVLDGVHRRLDGSTFPVEVAVASHDVAGTDYVLAIVRDVKGRRHAADALAESETRYATLLEHALDAVYLTTRAGEIVEANPAALELFGYRRSEFIGLDARAIMPRVEDIRRFQRQMAEAGVVTKLGAARDRICGAAPGRARPHARLSVDCPVLRRPCRRRRGARGPDRDGARGGRRPGGAGHGGGRAGTDRSLRGHGVQRPRGAPGDPRAGAARVGCRDRDRARQLARRRGAGSERGRARSPHRAGHGRRPGAGRGTGPRSGARGVRQAAGAPARAAAVCARGFGGRHRLLRLAVGLRARPAHARPATSTP